MIKIVFTKDVKIDDRHYEVGEKAELEDKIAYGLGEAGIVRLGNVTPDEVIRFLKNSGIHHFLNKT